MRLASMSTGDMSCKTPQYASLEAQRQVFFREEEESDDNNYDLGPHAHITFLGDGFLKLAVPASKVCGQFRAGDIVFYGILKQTQAAKETEYERTRRQDNRRYRF
jgi:hypothetical protein